MGIPLCNNRFPITGDGGTLYLPYCSNQSIDTANTAIVRVIFAIHGADPIAQSYLDSTLESARMVSPHVELTVQYQTMCCFGLDGALSDGDHIQKMPQMRNNHFVSVASPLWTKC